MKIFGWMYLLSFFLCAHSLTFQEAREHVKDCMYEFKYSREDINMMRKEKSSDLDCFTACIMKKRGSLKDGKIDSSKMLEILTSLRVLNGERNQEKVTMCVSAANRQSNECLVARDMIGCLFYKTY